MWVVPFSHRSWIDGRAVAILVAQLMYSLQVLIDLLHVIWRLLRSDVYVTLLDHVLLQWLPIDVNIPGTFHVLGTLSWVLQLRIWWREVRMAQCNIALIFT